MNKVFMLDTISRGDRVNKNPLLDYARYGNLAISFGVTLILSLLFGFWGGRWLDNRFGTFPIFLIIGILFGVFVSFWSLLGELQVFTKTRDVQRKLEQTEDRPAERNKGAKKP